MTIFVSRHRLTECPSCKTHIRVAEQVAETACPFCGAVLGEALAKRPSGGLGAVGRGSLVAGALLGLSAISACDDPEPQPVYGLPADVVTDGGTDSGTDVGPQPLYGLPADIQVDTAPDAGPQPEYGIPADQ